MGSTFDTWNGVEGAYYMGAGTSMEAVWLFLSIGMCVYALVVGLAHEKSSYNKAEQNK